jgi:hypothetical protein
LIKLSHWITTSGRKRTARGSLAMARLTLNCSTRSTIHLNAVEMVVRTDMEAISAKEMAVTLMAIGTMEDSEETTPMTITMVITMGTMDSTATTQKPRRISHISPISSARRLDILQTIALRRSLMNLPSLIHSRRPC